MTIEQASCRLALEHAKFQIGGVTRADFVRSGLIDQGFLKVGQELPKKVAEVISGPAADSPEMKRARAEFRTHRDIYDGLGITEDEFIRSRIKGS